MRRAARPAPSCRTVRRIPGAGSPARRTGTAARGAAGARGVPRTVDPRVGGHSGFEHGRKRHHTAGSQPSRHCCGRSRPARPRCRRRCPPSAQGGISDAKPNRAAMGRSCREHHLRSPYNSSGNESEPLFHAYSHAPAAFWCARMLAPSRKVIPSGTPCSWTNVSKRSQTLSRDQRTKVGPPRRGPGACSCGRSRSANGTTG